MQKQIELIIKLTNRGLSLERAVAMVSTEYPHKPLQMGLYWAQARKVGIDIGNNRSMENHQDNGQGSDYRCPAVN